LRREPERRDGGFGERDLVVWDAGDQQILPDGETDIAVAEVLPDFREPPHLLDGDLADRNTTPIQFSPACFCARTPMCAARSKLGRSFTASPGARMSFQPRFSSTAARNFSKPPGIEHVLQPRFVAVGAVAMLDEHAHHGVGDFRRILRLDDHAGVAREVAVAGDAAEREANQTPGSMP
jgi:hypothetical protein